MEKIAPALVKAKRSFAPAMKDKTNPAFRSKYADLGACIDAVEDALLANGIALIQQTFEDATGVTVETVFLHESGQELRCGRLHVPAAKQDPQGYGSALTYARRYSLMAACGIAPEDDDGNAASRAKPANDVRASGPALIFGALQPEEQDLCRKIAATVTAAMPDMTKVLFTLDMASLENEMKTGVWHLLDSGTRSAIKAAQAARDQAPALAGK
jgi:hypothetical protein